MPSIGDRLRAFFWPTTVKEAQTAPPYASRVGRFRFTSDFTTQRGRAQTSMLRNFADRCEPLRMAINRRTKQVAQADWRIVRTDDPERPPDPRVVDTMKALLTKVNDSGLSFGELIRMFVEDTIVLDAGCIEKELTLGGKSPRTASPIHALWPVDGATIEIDPSWVTPKSRGGQGCDPNGIRYRQRDPRTRKIEAELRDNQLIYLQQHPTSHRLLGYSQVEMVLMACERFLYGEQYAYDLIRNPVPPGLLGVPGLDETRLAQYRTYLNEELGVGEVPVIGTDSDQGAGLSYVRTAWSPKDLMFDEYRECQVNIIAYVMEMDRTFFGLIDDVNRSTSETLSQQTDQGFVSLATLVADVFTREIVAVIDPNHGFEFVNLVGSDPLVDATVATMYVKAGIWLPNEARAKQGMPPREGGDQPGVPGAPSPLGGPAPDSGEKPPTADEPAANAEDPKAAHAKAIDARTLVRRANEARLRYRSAPTPANLAAWTKAQAALEEVAAGAVPFQRDAEGGDNEQDGTTDAASPNAEREHHLNHLLSALLGLEGARLAAVWRARALRLRHRIAEQATQDGDWRESDFAPTLDGLGGEIVSLDAYREAVNDGRKAFPGVHQDDTDPVIARWTGHVTEYAVEVPARLAADLAVFGNSLPADASARDIVDAYNAKLDALEESVTRYAGPLWGAGQEGYGQQLDAHGVLLAWVIDSGNPCEDCSSFADGGPYSADDLPAWPGDGTSQCLDHCRCSIIADADSWADAMDQAA